MSGFFVFWRAHCGFVHKIKNKWNFSYGKLLFALSGVYALNPLLNFCTAGANESKSRVRDATKKIFCEYGYKHGVRSTSSVICSPICRHEFGINLVAKRKLFIETPNYENRYR